MHIHKTGEGNSPPPVDQKAQGPDLTPGQLANARMKELCHKWGISLDQLFSVEADVNHLVELRDENRSAIHTKRNEIESGQKRLNQALAEAIELQNEKEILEDEFAQLEVQMQALQTSLEQTIGDYSEMWRQGEAFTDEDARKCQDLTRECAQKFQSLRDLRDRAFELTQRIDIRLVPLSHAIENWRSHLARATDYMEELEERQASLDENLNDAIDTFVADSVSDHAMHQEVRMALLGFAHGEGILSEIL